MNRTTLQSILRQLPVGYLAALRDGVNRSAGGHGHLSASEIELTNDVIDRLQFERGATEAAARKSKS